MRRLAADYVLPLRWHDDTALPELTAYLTGLTQVVDVTVVDGSPTEIFQRHRAAWQGTVRHLPPEPWPGRNGKVRNVMTGLRAARHDTVVIADDDVRYTPETLGRGLDLLRDVDLLVPQNVFTHWPWHARWDGSRQLVNRAFRGDYPGTLLLRRDALGPEGYDGDVLFENLELIRTVERRGGVVRRAPDLFVARRPPTARHFWSQRVRQAYDDLAQPGRLALEAGLLPAVLLAGRHRGPVAAALGGVAVLAAAWGRHRAGAAGHFPPTTPLWAPLWLTERALCVWAALGLRLAGGVRYGDGRLLHAATPRHRPRAAPTTPTGGT